MTARTPAAPPPPPWTLVYADGAANVYRFQSDADGERVRFTHEPVTSECSSTGHYSGGAPVDERIAADDARIAAVRRSCLVARVATRAFEAFLHHDLRGVDA